MDMKRQVIYVLFNFSKMSLRNTNETIITMFTEFQEKVMSASSYFQKNLVRIVMLWMNKTFFSNDEIVIVLTKIFITLSMAKSPPAIAGV